MIGRALGRAVLFAFGAAAALTAQEPAYTPDEPLLPVHTWRGEWRDSSRGRTIPATVFYPSVDHGAAPVVLFSHGLGGSRNSYGYLGRCWASRGYVSIHLQHPGSDTAILEGLRRPLQKLRRLKEAALDSANLVDRPRDVAFVIGRLTPGAGAPHGFPSESVDTGRIGVAGHSFGAYTVMALAGQAVGPDGALRYYGPDPRISAGIAMSSSPALTADLDEAYRRVVIPIFHMTGTKDEDPAVRLGTAGRWQSDAVIGATTAEERRVAYDHTHQAPAYLLTFQDGDHRVFSGRPRDQGGGEHDEAYQRLICEASTAFWDATLRGDEAAARWFEKGGFTARLGTAGVFERKRPPAVEGR